MKIGYARCSTDGQDLTAQRGALATLGVEADRIYVDHGFTGRHRARPGLDQALAAVREGDELVVSKLDRLGRSIRDLQDIADELAARGVSLNIGGQLHDPSSPFGRLFFNLLGLFAEFESDMIRARTKEGLDVARSRGRLRGRQPKLSERQRARLRDLAAEPGRYNVSELAEMFSVSRATVYRTLQAAA